MEQMETQNTEKPAPIRVLIDGCYDIFHFGHGNALRQAKELGDVLVVGVHSDEEITEHKGPPVFTMAERSKMIRGLKWVDEVAEGLPYLTKLETMDKYRCLYCAHGDDVTVTADGLDSYRLIKAAGRYREIRRTAGISTTDLVGRMLLLTREHFKQGDEEFRPESGGLQAPGQAVATPTGGWTDWSSLLPSTRRIAQFSDTQSPRPGDRIIYTAGAFDLLHVGHMDFLEKARALGDYLIVGLHTDSVVNGYRGKNYPIMNLHERVLNVLTCKYVSEVIIGAPYKISKDLMNHLNVSLVCHGKTPILNTKDGLDPNEIAKQMGKFKIIDSNNDMTTEKIIQRIILHRLEYEERNRKSILKQQSSGGGGLPLTPEL